MNRPHTSEGKFPEIKKQSPCLCSKSSSSLSSLTLGKEKTANFGTKNSPNLRRVTRSRANTWEKETNIDLPVESHEEILIKVAQLSRGDIFVSTNLDS